MESSTTRRAWWCITSSPAASRSPSARRLRTRTVLPILIAASQNVVNALLNYVNGVPPGTTSFQFVTPVLVSSVGQGFTNGYVQQWNFNVQREIVKDFVVTAAYVGTKGTHLQIPEEVNGAPYIPGDCGASACSTSGNINQRRLYQPFAAVESIESNGNSTYHALQLSLKKRFGAGYSILAFLHVFEVHRYDGGRRPRLNRLDGNRPVQLVLRPGPFGQQRAPPLHDVVRVGTSDVPKLREG